MRIALDARELARSDRRGIGKTLRRLYETMLAERSDLTVFACCRPEQIRHLPAWPNLVPALIDCRGDRFDRWRHHALPRAARRLHADVLHAPANFVPRQSPVPLVATIHDLIPLDHPQTVGRRDRRRFLENLRLARRHAAAILTPSHDTRRRLVRSCGFAAQRVHVTPWGPPPPGATFSAVAAPEQANPASPRLALHFAAADPRKNTTRVVEAWRRTPAAVRAGWRLVLVGGSIPEGLEGASRGIEIAEGLEAIDAPLDRSADIVRAGFVCEQRVDQLLRRASLLVYPSLAEGFGVPLLEAFSAGAAVLTSRRDALPEVAGDAAWMVDPTDTSAIARGLEQLMSDEKLRDRLIASGSTRLSRFSWRRTAGQTARVLREASCGVEARPLTASGPRATDARPAA